jgi:hypothetical protein
LPESEENDPGGVVLLPEADETAQILVCSTNNDDDTRTVTWDSSLLDLGGETSPLTLSEDDGDMTYPLTALPAFYPDPDSTLSTTINLAVNDADGPKGSDAVTAKQAEIAIYRDGEEFNSDFGPPNVYAGEVLSLKVVLKDSPDNTKYPTDIVWTVSGQRLKDYDPTKETDQATELSEDDLKAKNIEFHWISGGSQTIEVTGKVGGALRKTTVSVNVMRPKAHIVTTSDGTPKPDLVGNIRDTGTYFTALAFIGLIPKQVVRIGGFIHFEGVLDENIAGTFEWLQIVNYSHNIQTQINDSTKSWNLSGLDIGFPYASKDNYTVDGPESFAIRLPTKALEYTSGLTMYYMYKPALEKAKWVPIRSVDWDFTFKAHCDDTNPPANADPWKMDQDDMAYNPADSDCLISPTWSYTIPHNPPLE